MSNDCVQWQARLSALPRRPGAPARVPTVDRRAARVAVALATAHQIAAAIESGRCGSGADAARVIGRSRNRVAQLCALVSLAPDIQEQVLEMEAVGGVEPVTEKWLFEQVARSIDWEAQRAAWRRRKHVGARSSVREPPGLLEACEAAPPSTADQDTMGGEWLASSPSPTPIASPVR